MDPFPRGLKNAVNDGSLIPFVGAGVSMEVRRSDGTRAFPGWSDLVLAGAERLTEECYPEDAERVRLLMNQSPPDFFGAAQIAQGRLGPLWVALLCERLELDFDEIQPASLDLARAIWELAPNLVITSNFELVMRWACPKPQNIREWGLDDPHGFVDMLSRRRLVHPAVWHLHGMVARPHQLVLGLPDYERLYKAGEHPDDARRWASALSTLHQILATRPLLFVGFSFADTHFLDQLQHISKLYQHAGPTHYVTVLGRERDEMQARFADRSIQNVHCIPFPDYGPPLIELLRNLATFGPKELQGPDEPSPLMHGERRNDQSSGFISLERATSGTTELLAPLPAWVVEQDGSELDALLLLDGWQPRSEQDCEAAIKLGCDVIALERLCVRLVQTVDAPLRRFEDRSGREWYTWAHPERAWNALAAHVAPTQLRNFVDVATSILGERNPALDMSAAERFLATVQGKVLKFSETLRQGVAKNLARLSASEALLRISLGQSRSRLLANRVVHEVLEPDWKLWASLNELLPWLAEAAPTTFLERLESSLGSGPHGAAHLLKEESALSGTVHTGVLWALETIGWRDDSMQRVALVLAKLAAGDPGGRTANRPEASLANLLHPARPQSSSSAKERTAILRLILEREPNVGWSVAVGLFGRVFGGVDVLFPSRRPQLVRWDIREVDYTATGPEIREQLTNLLEMLLLHAETCEPRWIELLELTWRIPAEVGKKILSSLAQHLPADRDSVLSTIRELLHDGYEFADAWKVDAELLQQLQELYGQLTPGDIVERSAWLFDPTRGAPERIEGGWEAHQARLLELRATVVDELLQSEDRWQLLDRLAARVTFDGLLGATLADAELGHAVEARLLESGTGDLIKVLPGFAARRFAKEGLTWLAGFVETLVTKNRPEHAALAMSYIAPSTGTLDFLAALTEAVRDAYWRRLHRVYGPHTTEEWEGVIDGFLSVDRVRDAFEVAAQARDDILPFTALRVLEHVENACDREEGDFFGGNASYQMERVFLAVDRLMEQIPVDRVIGLELKFLGLLDHTGRGARCLFSALETQPEFFAQLVGMLHSSENDADDKAAAPADVDSASTRRARQNAYRILAKWSGYPGRGQSSDAEPGDKVFTWAREALELTSKTGRPGWGAYEVGRVLARVPAADDGVWPCRAARQLLAADGTSQMARGMYIEQLNSRGMTSRAMGEGGAQERGLSEGYREDARKLRSDWPEAASLLEKLAENYQLDAEREDAVAEADRHGYES